MGKKIKIKTTKKEWGRDEELRTLFDYQRCKCWNQS